ncbi:polyketide synthase [Apiospora saccharicola]|uniref:Polyketide synthase n=1 Tax=Apiospora saccharicola TaxID=335842 RepID=A0ABR1U5L4_9PEZI
MSAPTDRSIAIVGMGCRFAGDATSPDKLWELLEHGQNVWSPIDNSRFNASGIYHPNGQRIGSTNVKGGHFLKQDVAAFDASFFNMTTDMASSMDPQYRMMLEVVYESLESAGITMEKIAGSDTSVYAGLMFRDYHDAISRDPDTIPRYFMTGNAATMASNRISHFLDLRGASMTVDTGCSTTLTALHLAVQSLRSSECGMSIVTGGSLMLNPDVFLSLSNLGMLSADGMSFAFDSRANGYGRGEGVAALVIKRLDDALRDGDCIRAVIRETALNQDGRTPTITTPDGGAQERLIRSCYEKAGLDPSLTAYVEAHGTGTPVGDPIEISALSAAFEAQKSPEHPLLVGSIKSNIGHTEAASGLASIIKVHWPKRDGDIRRASINNFGFGGANAHTILEGCNSVGDNSRQVNGNAHANGPNGASKQSTLQPRLYLLSATNQASCQKMAHNLRDHLLSRYQETEDEQTLLDSVAYTLGSHRSRFPFSISFSTDSLEGLGHKLQDEQLLPTRAIDDTKQPRLGWVFTGQGAQWYAMGRELLDAYPVFKEAILECDAYIREMGAKWTIMETLLTRESPEELQRDEVTTRINEAQFSLPLSTAIQLALVRLLWSWGVTPTAISSHSSGEVAAAYAAGALTCRAAIGITYIRGALTRRAANGTETRKGGMLAAGLSRDEANAYISQVNCGKVVVACVNSQSSVTISGDVTGLDELERALNADGVFARRLKVTEAFHSEYMRPLATAFGDSMVGMLQAGSTRPVLFASPKEGRVMEELDSLSTPGHWVDAMMQPVEFEAAFCDMCFEPCSVSASGARQQQVDLVMEVGPHGSLSGPIRQIMSLPEFKTSQTIPYLSCLSRGKDAISTMHLLAAELLQSGYRLNMDAVNFPRGRPQGVRILPNLPTYAWDHQRRHWRDPRENRSHKQKERPPHDLVGSLQPNSPPFAPTWRHLIRPSDIPWTRHHMVESNIVYPGAGFICMAIEGFSQMRPAMAHKAFTFHLRDVEFSQALLIPDDDIGVEARMTIRSCSDRDLESRGWHQFQIHSVSGENAWTAHCSGLIQTSESQLSPVSETWENTVAYTREIEPKDLWASLRAVGIYHGPSFQNISQIRRRLDQAYTSFYIADVQSTMPYNFQSQHFIHPTTLDSIVQAGYAVLPNASAIGTESLIPRRLNNLTISSAISTAAEHALNVVTHIKHRSAQNFGVNLSVTDGPNVVIEIEGLTYQSIGNASGTSNETQRDGNIHSCVSWRWGPDITLPQSQLLGDQMKIPVQDSEVAVIKKLRRCTIHYIQECVEALTEGDISTLEWHHQKYYGWMRNQVHLASENKLGPASAGWLLEGSEDRSALRTRVSRDSVNGEMLVHLGPEMASLLKKEKAPLQLMMEGKLLTRYYADAIKWGRSCEQAAQLVQHCVHKNPRAKILEVGGGTGGCTQVILDALDQARCRSGEAPFGQYDFTDISSGFFEAAKERFETWRDFMQFRKLDIESDVDSQGFEPGSYDVIVACQVLHATSNIRRTLRHVRSLLKPGGQLILVETTNDQTDLFFVFGLLPGWWLSEEDERKHTPSLTVSFWNQVLSESGMSGVDLEVRDCESDEFYMLSTMCSTAVEDAAPALAIEKQQSATQEVLLIPGDGSTAPEDWLHELRDSLANMTGFDVSVLPSLTNADLTGKFCVFLGEVDDTRLANAETGWFSSMLSIANKCKGLLWVANGGSMDNEDPWLSLHRGLLRTLRSENSGKRYVSLDLDARRGRDSLWAHETLSMISSVFTASFHDQSRENDYEYGERDGIIYIPRAHRDKTLNDALDRKATDIQQHPTTIASAGGMQRPFRDLDDGRRLRMDLESPGLLDSLFFRAEPAAPLPSGYIDIEPRAFGLNFRDVMVAMGQLEANKVMGFECAGVITQLDELAAHSSGLKVGDRVCALLQGHWSTKTRAPWTDVVGIPQDMDFVQAASMPHVFATALVALQETARLHKGERVLINAGAGGVGQAAIMLAQSVGVEVFVTVGTEEKRSLLMTKYGIQPDHIFSSRDSAFAGKIKAATGGKGVHVVLNSLSGSLLQESFDCLDEFGRFVDLGKREFEQNSRLGMLTFSRNVSFSSIDILSWQSRRGADISRILQSLMDLVRDKTVAPVSPITTYPISEIEKAFRLMQSGKHMGKIVVTADPSEQVPFRLTEKADDVIPPLSLDANATYLLVGGFGGIGRCLCEWLVLRGAKNLIVLSRNARPQRFLSEITQIADAAGLGSIEIRPVACDVSDEAHLVVALASCRDMPPIRGVIQGAMVLQDALLSKMTLGDFQTAVKPKVHGSWNLHKQLRGDVDFFIMLSSLVGVMGAAGQANYAAGCAFQDSLAAHRRARGQPAVSLDLGMIKGVGYVAEKSERGGVPVSERLASLGFQALHEEQVLQIIEAAIQLPDTPSTIVTGINMYPGSHWTEVSWMQERRFAGLQYREQPSSASGSTVNQTGDIAARSVRQQLTMVTSMDDASKIILEGITRKMAAIFGLREDLIGPSTSLGTLGVDSLVAVELRNWIMAQVAAEISTLELMQNVSLAHVAQIILQKSTLIDNTVLG